MQIVSISFYFYDSTPFVGGRGFLEDSSRKIIKNLTLFFNDYAKKNIHVNKCIVGSVVLTAL